MENKLHLMINTCILGISVYAHMLVINFILTVLFLYIDEYIDDISDEFNDLKIDTVESFKFVGTNFRGL